MRLIAVFALALSITLASAQAIAPKQGSPIRKAILDALRPPVEKDLGQRVVFTVDHLRVQGDWAFLTGKPKTVTGKPIDYKKTRYRGALDSGAFDDWICSILRRNGKKWKVVRYAIGATDVVWDGWDKEFKAPRGIFPYGT